MINMVKLPTSKSELFLRVAKGHFATSHSHINYYIDVTTQKTRLSEAKAVAKELVSAYQHSTIVDTVLCLDGTQVIGTCLANELTKDGFTNMNAHKTIYIVTPSTLPAARSFCGIISPPWSRASTCSSLRHPSPPATPFRQPWKP